MTATATGEAQVPLSARVLLAHAAVQVLAQQAGADVLFVKGPTTRPGLRASTTGGSDVDVIVRPAHAQRLLGALRRTGWELVTDFTSGSAFDHAANFFHPHWGLADVHRTYPGLDSDPEGNFEVLWQRRGITEIAHHPIAVPDPIAQALVVLLHAARTPTAAGPLHPDVHPSWFDRDDAHRQAVTDLAVRLGALTPLAVATGRADEVRDRRDAPLWIWFADGGSRLDEWRARIKVAPTVRAKVAVVARSFAVNEYYLAQRLGRTPTRTDVRREFVRRLGQAVREARPLHRVRAGIAARRSPE